MHPFDRLGVLAMRLDRRRLAVFPDGWGDGVALELFEHLPTASTEIPEAEVVWGRKEEHPGFRVRRGQLTSPAASLLPAEARVVRVEVMEPGTGTDRYCLMFPAWNNHGFAERRKLARLLVGHRLGVVMFDAPFYGRRRIVPERLQAIRTVADFALLGYGTILEGRALAGELRGWGQVGVSGFSMGGNLAALVSATLPFAVATAPLAASHSPGPVYLDGALRHAIAWEALGGREREPELRRLLSSASVLHFPPLPHHRAAVLVAGTRDGYVPATATQALASHWPGSDLRRLPAGHATLLWRHRPQLAQAILDSFDRLP